MVSSFKFILTNIEESKPLNHYVSADKLKQYVKQHGGMKFGETLKLEDRLSLLRLDRPPKK